MFETNLKLLYECGADTFLTNKKQGGVDTFYYHPNIVQETWSFHGSGVGFFVIKLFERGKKVANNTIKNFNNKKGNSA